MISLIFTLVVLGLIFYCISLLPLTEPFPTIIRIVAILIAILYLLQFLGVHTGVQTLW